MIDDRSTFNILCEALHKSLYDNNIWDSVMIETQFNVYKGILLYHTAFKIYINIHNENHLHGINIDPEVPYMKVTPARIVLVEKYMFRNIVWSDRKTPSEIINDAAKVREIEKESLYKKIQEREEFIRSKILKNIIRLVI